MAATSKDGELRCLNYTWLRHVCVGAISLAAAATGEGERAHNGASADLEKPRASSPAPMHTRYRCRYLFTFMGPHTLCFLRLAS